MLGLTDEIWKCTVSQLGYLKAINEGVTYDVTDGLHLLVKYKKMAWNIVKIEKAQVFANFKEKFITTF